MKFSREQLRASGYPVLLALRCLNIFTLLLVAGTSWLMIVKSGMTGQFNFFDMLSHFFAFLVTVPLIVSECGLMQKYFDEKWPLFGERYGFFWLGLVFVMLGCGIMSDLGKPVYFFNNIGAAEWRIVMAAGILSIVTGLLNIIATLVYTDSKAGISARIVRKHGKQSANAVEKQNNGSFYSHPSTRREKDEERGFMRYANRATQIFTKRKDGGVRGNISHPMPPPMAPHRDHDDRDVDRDVERDARDKDTEVHRYNTTSTSSSSKSRKSPIDNTTVRPPSAIHPAYHNGRPDPRYSIAVMSDYSANTNYV